MSAVARMVMLDLRTVAPYRYQGLGLAALVVVLLVGKSPAVLVPALVLLLTTQIAGYPFLVADKAGLETLYAVLPVRRRTVLYGHYAWALACFVVTVALGATIGLLSARAQAEPFSGKTLLTVVTLSWALFVLNVAIQFPLFIRFGYSRISVLSTFVPVALVMMAVIKLHVTIVSFASLESWLPLLWLAGVAAIAASIAAAITADTRRVRHG